MFLLDMSKNQQSFAVLMHVAEELSLSELPMMKDEDSLICLIGKLIPTVSIMEWQFILPLKQLIRNKTSKNVSKNG
jgi:hypothetical protein